MFDEESPHARVSLADSRTFDHAWQIQSLSLPDGLAGAVAVSGGDWELQRYDSAAYSLAPSRTSSGPHLSSVPGKILQQGLAVFRTEPADHVYAMIQPWLQVEYP